MQPIKETIFLISEAFIFITYKCNFRSYLDDCDFFPHNKHGERKEEEFSPAGTKAASL